MSVGGVGHTPDTPDTDELAEGYQCGAPYRDGQVFVMSERCSTCLLRPDGSIRRNLEPGRARQVVRQNREAGTAFACHQTTFGQDPRGAALCRGYVDLFSAEIPALRLAHVLGAFVEQTPREDHQ